MDKIYLDYAANTPVDKNVLNKFNETTLKYFANPNSHHALGNESKLEIDTKTSEILKLLKKYANVDDDTQIIYTSGSSESNNLAIKGVAQTYKHSGKHIITTFLEHSSVSGPLTYLKEQGYEIDIVNIKEDGTVDLEHLKSLLRDDTILVSICYVDSEVGTVQPISKISDILKDYPNCIFHTDATQAIGKVKVDFSNVDLISFAPHKFYGLNGFGVLLKKNDIILEPMIHGGASTTIYRSGTPVIGQIVALYEALIITFKEYDIRHEYVRKINEKIKEFLKKYEDVYINTPNSDNVHILNVSVKCIKATTFTDKLNEKGVCVSIKSACTVTITPSRIVLAMTRDRKRALSSFRISLSHLTTNEEVDKFLEIFNSVYREIQNEKGIN